ncbi:MAG: hypothetical protein VB135_03345, partial [Burkholderia sp.]
LLIGILLSSEGFLKNAIYTDLFTLSLKRPEIKSFLWSQITANCGLNCLKKLVNQAPFGSPSTGRVVCHTSLT